MNQYQKYIHISRYAKWSSNLGRRETWAETVDRYVEFFDKRTEGVLPDVLWEEIRSAIYNLEVMPSMRALMTAGPALERENLSGFNCAYLAVNSMRSFSETLYLLMCGTGVGFSCERQEIAQLPVIPEQGPVLPNKPIVVVADSKRGWAVAMYDVIETLMGGQTPHVDYSKVRAAGERLKTFGGRASGPAPLRKLFEHTIKTFNNARGRRLTSIEVHDLMCVIGETVVVGGVRRSALISLSNLSDMRMREAKSGQWWESHPERTLANNSVAYTEKPDIEAFMGEWLSLVKSKSGERGIFNRVAAGKQAAKWGRRPADLNYGCNPCSEIILRDKQLCNLTEVVVRKEDSQGDLLRKVRIATILGTLQATLTDFGFLGEVWQNNTEEEALLGVSLTGIMDNELMSTEGSALKDTLNELRDYAREVNTAVASILGIKASAAITCVKPSGTVSQLVDSASGIHARHAAYYIRTVRVDKKDPLYEFMKSKGFPTEDDVTRPNSTAVVSFAVKAPEGCITRDDRTALESLKLWLTYQREWCEHKPSVTITVREHEWLEVGAWVYKHFDEVSGISFLPHSDHTYDQAPYQEITAEEFERFPEMSPFDWLELCAFESEDNTEGTQTLACTGGSCEI